METSPFAATRPHTDADAENNRPSGERRSVILARVARDARLDRNFLLLITLATVIATLGLLQGSTAVVIGAMLVSPLMGPIMGLGFGIATIESGLIKRSLITLAAGVLVAILVAATLIWLSPIRDVTDELRARTEPTLLDLAVAVIGGVAGVYAIMRRLSGVMVGVAIATALVPPLSTVAFGLVTLRPEFALGAALLFLTNTLAIALAATVVARINRFGPSLTPQHTAMQVVGIVTILGLLSVPLALSLNRLVRQAAARQAVQAVLSDTLGKRTRIDTLDVRVTDDGVTADGVILVGSYTANLNEAVAAAIGNRLKRQATVNLIQVRQEDSTALDAQRRLADRVSALEADEADVVQLLQGLGVGTLIDRDGVLVEPARRRALVRVPEFTNDDAARRFAETLERTRVDKVLWQIDLLPEDWQPPVAEPSDAAN